MSTVTLQPNLRKRRWGRYAVMLITAPPGWKPNSPRAMPPSIERAEFLARRLRASDAASVAQAHNLAFLRGVATGWAVVVSSMFGVD